jgi:hypothetical protein
LNGGDWELLAPGTNYITVTAWDAFGHSSSAWDSFYILKDTVPPSAISNLAASTPAGASREGDLYLTWTAPGDNALLGQTSYYLIRYKTDANFSGEADFTAASVYVSTLAPKAAGGAESLNLTGLNAGATYYLAVKAVDKAGNAGAISNFAGDVNKAYAGPDLTAPGSITDLAADMGEFQGQIALTWTAPGEGVKGDPNTGTAASYIVRYATFAITSGNFSSPSVSSYTQTWNPQAYGVPESRVIAGLTAGATYSIAVKAVDENGNIAAISNNPVTSSATPAGAASGMMVYGEGASDTPRYRNWTPDSWSGQGAAAAADATVRWSVLRSVPVVANVKVAGFLASNNSLKFLKWDGLNSSWTDITMAAAPAPGGSATRKFDLAPENLTGRMLAVYYNGTNGAVTYAVWSSTAATPWVVSPTQLPMASFTGTSVINWVRLKPLPGTNKILLMVLDSNSYISAAIWNGSSWVDNKSLTTAAAINTTEVFDGDWETFTGDALVLWGTGTTTAYRKWRSTGTWDGSNGVSPPNIGAAANWIRVCADPNSNRLGMTSFDGASTTSPDWNVSIWRPAPAQTQGWATLPTEDSAMSSQAAGNTRKTDCAWESLSGKFMAAAIDAGNTQFDWLTWTNGIWSSSPSVATANTNTTFAGGINYITLVPDPNTNKITAYGIDRSSDLRSTLWGGSSWAGSGASNWTHETDISDVNFESAALAFDRHDNLAPTVVDNQNGDDEWRNNRVYYNIDAADNGGSRLASLQTKIFPQTGGGGTPIQDWTDQMAGINSDSYSQDWQLTQGTFDLMPQGVNYIAVRAKDGVGNASSEIFDAFYVKKDTIAPTITNHLDPGYDDVWHNSSQGAVYNVDFSDLGGSLLRSLEYSASSGPSQTGIQTLGWTVISSGSVGASYASDWAVNFSLLGHATNFISVRAIDNAFSTTTLLDAFKVLKDTQPPAAVADLAASSGSLRGSVSLTWTAPGDDGAVNDNGRGYYMVRSSTSQITTDALFNAASSYSQLWVPSAAGQPEGGVVYGLEAGKTYYFAVKTADKAGNLSSLSNQAVSAPQTANVYINEVYAAGAAGADWVELYNNTASTFTLTNWQLVYNQGSINSPGSETTVWTGASVDTVNVNGYFTVPAISLDETQSYHVMLKDSAGNIVDRVQWPVLPAGRSFARISDGDADFLEADPTPTMGYANSISTDPVKINEISYGVLASQFVELYNTGADTLTLSGYYLRNSYGPRFMFTRKIYSGAYALIDQSSLSSEALAYASVFGASGLSAAGDYLALENAAGQTVDRVVWQSASDYSLTNYKAALVSAASWAPANAVNSISRGSPEGRDTDDDSSDFHDYNPATPASRNNDAAGLASNTLYYPAASQILPRIFPVTLKFGVDSSAGDADTLVLTRTGGNADNHSPHLYRLADIGFNTAALAPQTSAYTGTAFADQDGFTPVHGAAYKLIINSDNGAGSAPQITRAGLIYDSSVHSVLAENTAPLRLNEGSKDDAVRIIVNNNSPYGYNSVEITSVTIRLLNPDASPMETSTARELFDSISLVKDSASGFTGSYDSANDILTAVEIPQASITLDAQGALTLTVSEPDGAAASAPAYSSAAYFVVFEAAAGAEARSTNTFRVEFSPASGIAMRDGPSDWPQMYASGGPVLTSSAAINVPAQPPAGTDWPYAPSGAAQINSPVGYYTDALVSSGVYVSAADGVLRAVKFNGSPRWEFQTSPASPITTSPLVPYYDVGDVYVYLATDNGDIYKVMDNEYSAQQIWKRSIGLSVKTNLIDSGDRIYFGADDKKVYCLNKENGNDCVNWNYDAGFTAAISGTLSLDDTLGINASWIGLDNGKVVRFGTTYGTITSAFQTGGAIKSSPFVEAAYLGGNNLYLTSTDGKLYSRTSSNLTTTPGSWIDCKASSAIYTSPFLQTIGDKRYVFFGDDAGKIYKVYASSGAAVTDGPCDSIFQARGRVRSSPVVVPWDMGGLAVGEDYIYFGSDDGYIYAVNANTGQLRNGWPVSTGGPVRADPIIELESTMTLIVGSNDGKTYTLYIGP